MKKNTIIRLKRITKGGNWSHDSFFCFEYAFERYFSGDDPRDNLKRKLKTKRRKRGYPTQIRRSFNYIRPKYFFIMVEELNQFADEEYFDLVHQ